MSLSSSSTGTRPLFRSRSDRLVAGVAGGLAHYLDVDPVLVRIGFVVAACLGGAGVVAYGAAWLLVPDEPGNAGDPPARLAGRRPSRRTLGIALAVVAALALVSSGPFAWDGRGGLGWAVVLLVLGVVLLRGNDRTSPLPSMGEPSGAGAVDELTGVWTAPAPPPVADVRPPGIAPYVLGGLAVLGGVWALAGWELVPFLALALLVVGAGVVIGQAEVRRAG